MQQPRKRSRMKFTVKNQEQLGLIKGSIFEYVEEDSLAKYLVKIIKMLDLRQIKNNYKSQGGKAIDPAAILGLLFLGYSKGLATSRDLEEMCRKHIDFIYVSQGLKPDHSTICRFRRRHEKEISEIFVQVIKISKEQGIGDYRTIAMDGTKIQASCSKKQSYNESKMEKLEEKVKAEIAGYLKQLAEGDKKDTKEVKEIKEKLSKTEAKKAKLEKLKAELIERKKKLQPKDRESHQINIVEPEALMMVPAGEKPSPSYNAQIAVDTKSGLIVSNYITQERNDEKQFFKQKENIEKNIGEDKKRIYEADSGYFSFDIVEQIDKEEVNAYIADPRDKWPQRDDYIKGSTISKKDFRYNKEKDCYECPNGKELKRVIRKNENKNKKKAIYRTNECQGCNYLEQCNNNKKWKGEKREILRDYREEYADKMKEKVNSEEGKQQMKIRSTTVEPVFGNIKSNIGLRRFVLRGLSGAQCEFDLVCIAHNLLKMHKIFIFLAFGNRRIAFFAVICCLGLLYRLTEKFIEMIMGNRKIFAY